MFPGERSPPPATHQASTPQRVLQRAAHAVLHLSPDLRVAAANARAEALLEGAVPTVAGTSVFDLFAERARPFLHHRLAQCQQGQSVEDLEVSLAGGTALVGITFLPQADGAVSLLLRDLTRERLERDTVLRAEVQEYRRASAENQKMIDLGKLIAGVTHEMRTPLTYATNNMLLSRAALRTLAESHPDVRDELERLVTHHDGALEGLERLRRLLEDLRPLTKNKPHRTAMMSLADLVVDAVRVFEATKPGTTRVELDLESTHPVQLDRAEMLNVLANLLDNAAQAMEHRGTILVRTRNRDTPPEIRVIDQGPGVPPDARERLFEPFHTTKPDGTGLGLFISRRTVEAHGGTLTYEETPGGGATFVVRLPADDAPA